MCLETLSEEKNVFFFFLFSWVNSNFERNCLHFWKKYINGWKHFLPRAPRTFGEKKISSKFFFKIFFGLWEKSFQTFHVLLIGRAFKLAFFVPEELCDAEQFFPSEWDNYKEFLTSDREFFGFLAKNVSRDFKIKLFVSGWTFWEKPVVSQNFLLSWIFSDTGRKMFKALSYFVLRQGHQKKTYVSGGSLWRKAKFFKCFKKRCFFLIIVYGLWSEKFALSEKKIVLVLITLFSVLCIQRKVPGENFRIKKLFFSKKSRILREKFSNFCEVVSGKVDIIPSYFYRGRFQGKIFSKNVSFSLFPDLEQKIDYWRNSRMFVKTLFYVSGGFFWRKTLFSKLYDIFFHVFRAKNCKIWKKIPQNCKNSILHV